MLAVWSTTPCPGACCNHRPADSNVTPGNNKSFQQTKKKTEKILWADPTDEVWTCRTFSLMNISSTHGLPQAAAAAPGSSPQQDLPARRFLSDSRKPLNDVEMALGGTLLPSISTFASGPTLKSKALGSANPVSITRLEAGVHLCSCYVDCWFSSGGACTLGGTWRHSSCACIKKNLYI